MAIDAKMDFMRQTEKMLAESVTVSDMSKIMNVISDVLQSYEMHMIDTWSDDNDDLLQCYVDALKVQGRSEKTIERYEYVIGRMMQEINVPTRMITVYHLRNYLSKQQERGIKDTTIEGIREIFSAYFNWLQRESLIEKNPVANLGTIKCAKLKKKTFTDVDIDNLKSNCKTIRDKAIICFLEATGCRISEAVGLDRDSIDFNGLQCVVHGKGNKERTVFIKPVVASVLQKYLNSRKDDNPALFVGKRKERLTPGGIRCMMKGLEERSGVDHVHPHKFRRTLATDLARHGMPIQEVAHILGHDKLDTTMKYVIQNEDDIKHDYRKYA